MARRGCGNDRDPKAATPVDRSWSKGCHCSGARSIPSHPSPRREQPTTQGAITRSDEFPLTGPATAIEKTAADEWPNHRAQNIGNPCLQTHTSPNAEFGRAYQMPAEGVKPVGQTRRNLSWCPLRFRAAAQSPPHRPGLSRGPGREAACGSHPDIPAPGLARPGRGWWPRPAWAE